MKLSKPEHTAYITAALVAIPVLVYAAVAMLQNKYQRLPVYSAQGNTREITPGIQPFNMYNQNGKIFSDKNVRDKIYVADFFFTSCTSICPKMTNNLKLVQDAFKGDTTVAIVSFTVDPGTDSAQRLKQYAARFKIDNASWDLLTGSKLEIYRLARKSFNVSAADGDGGPNDFIHSDKLVLVDKHKQVRGYYTGTDKTSVEQLIHDIKKLQDED